MKIKIDNEIYLKSDSRNISLYERKMVKDEETGEEKETFVSLNKHLRNIPQALESYLAYKRNNSNAETIEELAKDIRESIEYVKKFAEEFKQCMNGWWPNE